jgi:hypothetical protein
VKILCKYSGLEFQVQHFPYSLEAREISHPVFQIPQQKLLVVLAKKYPEGLTQIDAYLGFLALLHSTKRVDWRVPCYYTTELDSIIANNIEQLIRVVGITSAITHPAFTMPSFVITPDTRNLATVHHWIEIWKQSYIEFQEGNKRAQLHDRIVRREQAMERLIKDPSKSPKDYANQLAEWAALAGEFPTGTVPVDGKQIALSDYWKSMIRRAARNEAVFSLNETDLYELIEHCEMAIPLHGGIFGHALMKVLREAATRKKSLFDLGDFDIRTSTYRILSNEDSAERANTLAMIDSAPIEEPKQGNYPSKIAYLKALYKWKIAKQHAAQVGPVSDSELDDARGAGLRKNGSNIAASASAKDTLKALGE